MSQDSQIPGGGSREGECLEGVAGTAALQSGNHWRPGSTISATQNIKQSSSCISVVEGDIKAVNSSRCAKAELDVLTVAGSRPAGSQIVIEDIGSNVTIIAAGRSGGTGRRYHTSFRFPPVTGDEQLT